MKKIYINYSDDVDGILRNKVGVILSTAQLIKKKYPKININPIIHAVKEIVFVGDKLNGTYIKNEYKNLGVENSWHDGKPKEYIDCVTAEHELQETKLNDAGTHREYRCPKCLIFWKTDSSD